jgi:hypothetical protein
MTPAPTFSQIKAQVAAIRRKVEGARVFGIRAPGKWTGERMKRDGEQVYVIHQCDSPLAMRIALREELSPDASKVLVTGLDEKELSEDILLRLAKRQLFPLDGWQIVKSLFQANAIDPRLTRHRWIADYLMEYAPSGGYPVAGGGFLDAETAWSILLSEAIGLCDDRPDLTSILRWSTESALVDRYKRATNEFRLAASSWLAEQAGPAAEAVLRCALACDRPDGLPIGLALGVIYNPKASGKLEKAAGKFEERFLGGATLDSKAIERWGSAATEVIRLQMTDPRTKRGFLERADEILKEVGASEFAYLSSSSPFGFDQRLAGFGRTLAQIVESGRYQLIDQLRAARSEIADHEYAARDRGRLESLDMAIRLVRWLRAQEGQSAQTNRTRTASDAVGRTFLSDLDGQECPSYHPIDSAGPLSLSFVQAAQDHAQEGGFVDWARLAVGRGDSERILSEAYARLFERVTSVREAQSRKFAELLAEWTKGDHQSTSICPVERVLDDVVSPLAMHAPVLLIVIDGMSMAVCRELLPDIIGHEWVPLSRAGNTGQFATGLAAIPSVTEVSRTSLFCGALKQGSSSDEKAGFEAHLALKAASRGGLSPILFHKPSLRGNDDAILAGEVRSEIAASNRRIVGVVVNAVDDLLLKGEQVGHRWSRDSIPVLWALLHEAKLSCRIVVITSDHGHVIDRNSRFFAHDGGERWRTPSGELEVYEVRLSGRRVVIPESKATIVPWSENVRYGVKKFGYHGGANPQEMVVPIVVLSPSGEAPEGWVDAPSDAPLWWDDQPAAAATAEAKSKKTVSRRTEQPRLPMDFGEPPEAALPVPSAVEPKWVTKLLASPLFAQQKKLAGRSVPAEDLLRAFLRTLEERGGKMTSAAVSRAMSFPTIRLRGFVAVTQRLLNIDGFAILTRDEASDTVELNRELLKRQFELEQGKG